jgi:hypothetical protein
MAEQKLKFQNQLDLKLFPPDKQLTCSGKECNAEKVQPQTYRTNIPPLTVSHVNIERSKSLCAPDDYSTKNTQKYFKQFQSFTMIT